MSGEFGRDYPYFHTQLEYVVETVRYDAKLETTKKLCQILVEFNKLARDISWAEADDTGEDALILAAIEHFNSIKQAVEEADKHLDKYRQVITLALREAKK